MKFLCVHCNQPMKIHQTNVHKDIGSLSVVYVCPTCKHEMAMLTNPQETQLVTSLGITVGQPGAQNESSSASSGVSKCPFANMLGSTAAQSTDEQTDAAGTQQEYAWSPVARERLSRIPEFIRPMARIGIEKFAKDHGHQEITEEVLEEAKGIFGM